MAITAKVASAYVDLQANTAAFNKAMDDAGVAVRRFSSAMREETEKARAGIAMLNEAIGIHIPRHLQKVIAELPMVSTAINAAFVATPILLAGKVVLELVEKVHGFFEKVKKGQEETRKAWADAAKSMDALNWSLEVGNSKLQDQINKLEKKPGDNGIRTALLEALDAADKLGSKLDEDLSKLSQVKTSTGLAALFSGGPSATDQAASDAARRIQQIVDDYKAPMRSAAERGDTANVNELRNSQIAQFGADPKINADIAKLQEYLRVNQDLAGKHNEAFEKVASAYATLGGAVQAITQEQTKEALGQQERGDAGKGDKAQERLRQFEETLKNEKAFFGMSAGEELTYWADRVKYFDAGSSEYNSVMDKERSVFEENTRAEAEVRKRATGEAKRNAELIGETAKAVLKIWQEQDEDLTHSGERWKEYNSLVAKGAEQQAIMAARLDETKVKMALATGAIGPHAAAIMIAAAHVKEYNAQLQALEDELKRIKDDTSLTPVQKATQTQAVQNQKNKLKDDGTMQAANDAVDEFATTFRGAIDGVFDEVIKKSQETAEQLKQFGKQFVDSLNTELAKGMTGQKMDFHSLFQSGAQSLAKIGIEKGGGLITQMLGLGSGKKGDGYHTWVDNLPGGSTPGGAAAKAFGGGLVGMLNDSDRASSWLGGRLFGSGSFFGGGHALGGAVAAGVPIDVGELGRERFTPMVPGVITRNSELRGSGQTIMHIDARGTDPALTQANVARALQATRQQARQEGAMLALEINRRRPR